jgi:hypothetical protein
MKIDPITAVILRKDKIFVREQDIAPIDTQIPLPSVVPIVSTAAIIFGAHKLIQNFMTKAAQDCKDVPDKAGCIQQHKQQGAQAAIERLRGQIQQCRGDMECMQKIRRAIERMGGEA